MRFDSRFSLLVFLKIWKPSAFHESESKRSLFFGLFYGALMIIAVYNLFLFFSVIDKSYLYYFFFALGIGFYQSNMDGLSFRFFTNQTKLMAPIIVMSIYVAGIFWLLFAKEFLEVKKYSPFLHSFFQLMILILGLFIISLKFIPLQICNLLTVPI